MRAKFWVGGILIVLLAGVVYENVYLAGKKSPGGSAPQAKTVMVSLDKAKLQMIYFWGDCQCNENIAAEMAVRNFGHDVHSRIVRLEDPDRAALMKKYKVDKGPYTVFLNPKDGRVVMRMRWSTFDDFADSIHELLRESGYGFAATGKPVARGVAKVGKAAPEIDVVSEASIGITLDEYRGRKVVLAFLCGCNRCKPLIPRLNQLVHEQGQDRVTVLGITAFTTEVRDRFKSETKPDFPICIDLDLKTHIHYASEACPRLWVIDEQGIIRYTNKDILTPTAKLAAELHRQLGA
jgi:peroxiredoxin